jgi:hypothetical protein
MVEAVRDQWLLAVAVILLLLGLVLWRWGPR